MLLVSALNFLMLKFSFQYMIVSRVLPQISKSGVITKQQRDGEWRTLQEEIKRGGVRPFCRAVAQDNRMWAGEYFKICYL